MSDDKKLTWYRGEIDKIDEQILKLYEQRMDICYKIGEYKKENELSSYDPERETQLLEKVMDGVAKPEYRDGAAQLFITLMQSSCELQDKIITDDWEEEDPYADF